MHEQHEQAIWTEKYRPRTFSDIKGQKDIVNRIKAMVEKGNIPHLMLSGPAGVGKCVTGETLIVTGSGSVRTISDCYNDRISTVMTLDEHGKIKKGRVAYFFREKADHTILLTTTSGKSITATPEHPFLSMENGVPQWTEARNLRPGSHIASPMHIRPEINSEIIRWETQSCFWAKLSRPIKVKQADVLFGVQKNVVSYLAGHTGATIQEICKALQEKRGNVAWATAELVKKRILTSNRRKPSVFHLAHTEVESSSLPYEKVEDKTLIKEIEYITRLHKSKCSIAHFRETTPEFYEWLGLVFGDGYVHGSSIRFYNNDKMLRDRFVYLSNAVFGEKLEIMEKKDNCFYMEIMHARTITAMLEHFFAIPIHAAKARIIVVPPALFTETDEKVASFIRGFYECDGCFSRHQIEISSASQAFLQGISYLLLRQGISPRIARRSNQSYLYIRSSTELELFNRYIRPLRKKILIEKSANTNVDVMQVAVHHLKIICSSLGISRDALGSNSHLFDRGIGSRERVQQFYSKICEISRMKLQRAMHAIGMCEASKKLDDTLEESMTQLCPAYFRSEIEKRSHIRSDRLKDYATYQREPTLRNIVRILGAMKNLQAGSQEAYDSLIEKFAVRETLLETIQLLNISYAEIAETMDSPPSSVVGYLEQNGLSLQGVKKLDHLFIAIKSVLEKRVMQHQLLESLEIIHYLSEVELRWDVVKSLTDSGPQEVYDLNVHKTHNFIGGSGALILHNTSLALVIARELYGDNWRSNFLELNASDERGIDVVRVKIKDFARTKGLDNVPFKLVYLDEADALTKEAQQALRRTMENYTNTTRFLISCNYSSKIIDPIQSRCAVFRFKPLDEKDLLKIVHTIAEQENLSISKEAEAAIITVSGGDVRRLENLLQACASQGKKITEDDIFQIASFAKPKELDDMLLKAVKGDFLGAKEILLKVMLDYGLSGIDVIKQIQSEAWKIKELSDREKLEFVKLCGEAEFRMVEGSDEVIQLEALLAAAGLVKK